MSGPSLWTRLRAALTGFRNPQQVALPLPEPDVGLAPHLRALPLYDHWHPGGRTLFGYLHVTRQGAQVAGFTPYTCPAYGTNSLALQLEALLGGQNRPAVEVSRWTHERSGHSYWVLARATAQASSRPILDNEDVSIYENADGQLFIRRPSEFLDGRFAPENDRAREQAAVAAQIRADEPAAPSDAGAAAPGLDASLWAYDRDGYREALAEVARALEASSPGHSLAAWAGQFLARSDTETPSDGAENRRKARLWDALLGAQRLRLVGWSDKNPGNYRHFGLEAWSIYPGHDFSESNVQARKVLTDFAEAAVRAQGDL